MVEGLDWHDWEIQHDIEPETAGLPFPGPAAPASGAAAPATGS